MTWRSWVLWLTFGLPTLLQGWLLGAGALMVRRAADPYFVGPVLVTTKNKGSQQYTTTLGGWINKSVYATHKTIWHEFVHLEQYLEFNVLAAFLAASLIPALGWWSFLVWGTSGLIWLGPNYLVAFILYKRRGITWTDACYYWTSHEQDAYARTLCEFDGLRSRWERE